MGLEGVVRSFASDDQGVESSSEDLIEQKERDEEEKDEEEEEIWGGKVLGLNPNIRIYRYSAGQFFAKHCKSGEIKLESFFLLLSANYLHD